MSSRANIARYGGSVRPYNGPSILESIARMTGKDRVTGGPQIQTMPGGDVSTQWSPYTAGSGFLSRGARSQADAMNAAIAEALFLNQEQNKGRMGEIKEQGNQARITNADVNKLNQDIERLKSELAQKEQILQQNLGVASKLGVTARSPQDLEVMAQALNDPTIQAALQQIQMRTDTLNTQEGREAYRQGTIGSLQAPVIDNIAKSRFQTPPATINTMPEVSKEGMINVASPGKQTTGLLPFSEEVQNMIQQPGGFVTPGDVTRRTGYSIPRPPQFRQNTGTNAPVSAPAPIALPPAPIQTTPPPQASIEPIGTNFFTGNTGTTNALPTMPTVSGNTNSVDQQLIEAIRKVLSSAPGMIKQGATGTEDVLRRVLGWSPRQ